MSRSLILEETDSSPIFKTSFTLCTRWRLPLSLVIQPPKKKKKERANEENYFLLLEFAEPRLVWVALSGQPLPPLR